MSGLSGVSKLVAHAVVGGLASVAGGGKLENGAVTAAFGYLFNELGNKEQHQRGVEIAKDELYAQGFKIVPYNDVSHVSISGGLFGVRVYDFLIEARTDAKVYGVEVKTSRTAVLWLDADQVQKDTALIAGAGQKGGASWVVGPRNPGLLVEGVKYFGVCFGCNFMYANNYATLLALNAASVKVETRSRGDRQ